MMERQEKMTTITNTTTLSNPILYVPKIMFLTKGKGLHKDYLTSFELALRDAEIADLNLVSVSSIKPPHCKIISLQEGRKHLMSGQIVFTVLARSSTNEPNRLIAASVGLNPFEYSDSYIHFLAFLRLDLKFLIELFREW